MKLYFPNTNVKLEEECGTFFFNENEAPNLKRAAAVLPFLAKRFLGADKM